MAEQKNVPSIESRLRHNILRIPPETYAASGIVIYGRRIKSLVFTTDIAIIRNCDADAVLAVYPFTPQSSISKALIEVSDVPVFVGVGGGVTSGERSVRLAEEAEHQGAYGIVVNAPIAPEIITWIKERVELPVVATIISQKQDIEERVRAGADILNVAASKETPALVAYIKEKYPDMPVIATGGPSDETIRATIAAGANAITYTPPSSGDIFAESMRRYRHTYEEGAKNE